MSAPGWSPSMSVGNDILDQHHKTLFDLVAELDAGIRTGADEPWARHIADRLTSYMDYHFREEEALLEATDYPFLQFHRGSHQAIIMRVSTMLEGLGIRPLHDVLAELRDFVGDWLSHHIEIEDFEYKPFLSSRE